MTITWHRPYLYPKQFDAIFAPERIAVVEASTKSGKTHGCIVWLTEKALLEGKEGRHYWWIAPTYGQAKIAYTRLKLALSKGTFKANDTAMSVTLLNGAVMEFKTGEKPDHLYGEDVYAAVMDEATRTREEAWHAVRSTLTATKGQIRIIGNVRGRRNWVYRMARRSDADVSYARITALDAAESGIIDKAEIEAAQRDLPTDVFKQLYLAEPADDGGNPFGLDAIERCVLPDGIDGDHPVVCYGVDLAKSYDWTVVIGLDHRGFVQTFERWQGPWEATVERIQTIVGDKPALVDATGVGDPVVERLQRTNRRIQGFKFSSLSKQQLMEGLALAIQHGEIAYPEGPIVDELSMFEYEYHRTGVRYAAPSGAHDDCVDSLGLAVLAFRDKVSTGYWPYNDDETIEPLAVLPHAAGVMTKVH